MRVLIIGAGGHGQVVADILLAACKQNGGTLRPIGFVDDDPALWRCVLLGLPVLGPTTRLSSRIQHAIVGIGHNQTRRDFQLRLAALNKKIITAIHPSAVLGAEVEIQEGTAVCARVVVNPGARIGRGVVLNTACTVDHHNRIGDYAHIAPGVHLGGDVEIGEGTLVGIGATVLPQRRVGAWSIIGAGAVVTADVPDYTTVVGVPARMVKSSNQSLKSAYERGARHQE